jgi:hypothetical protein
MKPNIVIRILRALFIWRVNYPSRAEVLEQLAKAKKDGLPVAILTHDIGLSKGNVPGKGNWLLASALAEMLKLVPNNTPVLAQTGVAIAGRKRGLQVTKMIGPPTLETRLDQSSMAYNSNTVIAVQRGWLAARGMFPHCLVFVLTSPDHMPRVKWLMERQGFTNIIPVPLLSYRQRDYLDPNALYPAMRWAARVPCGIVIFRAYKLMIRTLFICKGLI